MTDTTIRVYNETRRRLNMYRAQYDLSHDDAIRKLLNEAGAPEVCNE